MPAPGDQHTAVTNPFHEPRLVVSEWTAKEIASIAAKLDKQLGPEYISSRAGPGGGKVHYLTAEKVISLANEVFGFNGWSSSIQNIQVDFADEDPNTHRYTIGLSVIVRVTLRDGTFHEDIGYGSIENAKGKAMAFEKAKKEGTTDGMKRALRSFGQVLGNCIYDKDYVRLVTKVKAEPVKTFNQDNLFRHPDFVRNNSGKAAESTINTAAPKAAPIVAPLVAPTTAAPLKPEPAGDSFEDFLGELDEADFCVSEEGHPDEVVLSTSMNGRNVSEKSSMNAPPQQMPQQQQQQQNRQPGRSFSGGNNRQPHTPNQAQSRPGPQNGGYTAPPNRPQQGQANRTTPNNPVGAPRPPPPPQTGNIPETVGFFSAKAVSQLPEASIQGSSNIRLAVPQGAQAFNPKAESPSIPKTPGIDHSSSKPVSRTGQHVPPSSQAATTNPNSFTPVRPSMNSSQATRGNVVNPSLDHTRRIGAPGGPGSPLANRGSYRPPTMKRPPLVDLPVNQHESATKATENGSDAKRQRMA
ncbi:hypothetical protein G7046_g9646 [Stylonectria norvegica]|nr:hypothetical protein G7046_g9646 [Stylonectria norvegica]